MPLNVQRAASLVAQALPSSNGTSGITIDFISRLVVREPVAVAQLKAAVQALRDSKNTTLINADVTNTALKASLTTDVIDLDTLIPTLP